MIKPLWLALLLSVGTSPAVAQRPMLRTICNACDAVAMGQAARALGDGEHLIIDATGKTFRKYTVACGGGRRETEPLLWSATCTQPLQVIEQPATPADLAAFAQLRALLTPEGAVRGNAVITVDSPHSIYDLAHRGPSGALNSLSVTRMSQVKDAVWPAVVSFLGWAQPTGLQWLGAYWDRGPRAKVQSGFHVRIHFPDRSSIMANVDIRPMLSPMIQLELRDSRVTVAGPAIKPDVAVLPEEARDAEGEPVPGLNPYAAWPNVPEHRIVRRPSNVAGFEALATSHGVRILATSGASDRSPQYTCGVQMLDEAGPSVGDETVCLRE
jgi:hypothetical protein